MGWLGNSPRAETVFTLEAAKSYAFGLRFLMSKSGNPVNLVDAQVKLVALAPRRAGGGQVINLDADMIEPELGLTQFNLQASDLDLDAGEYPFSIVMLSSIGYTTVVVKGILDIHANVAEGWVDESYPNVNPGTNLAAYLESGDVVEVKIDQVDGLSVVINDLIVQTTADMEAQVAAAQGHAAAAAASSASAAQKKVAAEQAAAQAAQYVADMQHAWDFWNAAIAGDFGGFLIDAINAHLAESS